MSPKEKAIREHHRAGFDPSREDVELLLKTIDELRSEEANFIVRSLQTSVDTFSGSGEFVRLDGDSWEKLKRRAKTFLEKRSR